MIFSFWSTQNEAFDKGYLRFKNYLFWYNNPKLMGAVTVLGIKIIQTFCENCVAR